MNTEQERAEFEAWWEKEGQYCRAGGGDYEKTFAYRAYQAGRAALQSQDREDAERLQAAARDMFVRASEIEILYGTNKETEGLVMAAIRLAYLVGPTEQVIDRARRIEGDGE